MVNKQLIASLMRSKCVQSIHLAVALANWDVYYLKEIMRDEKFNPSHDNDPSRSYVAFCYTANVLHVCSASGKTVQVRFPENKKIHGANILSFK